MGLAGIREQQGRLLARAPACKRPVARPEGGANLLWRLAAAIRAILAAAGQPVSRRYCVIAWEGQSFAGVAAILCGGLVRIELNCADCGGNRFSFDHGNADGSLVLCEDCGHKIGTLGKLKEMVAEEVLRRISGGDPEEIRN